MDKFFTAFFKITSWPLKLYGFRSKTYYEDKRIQSKKIKGSAIVISNHTSVYDFGMLLYTFFGRNMNCLMAEVLFKKKALAWFLKKLGGIKVNRYAYDFSFIKPCSEILKKGGIIEIYPESRIPLENEEKPLPFKTGAALLAYKTREKIIPVYTEGRYFKFKRNHLIIGTPINPNDYIDNNLSERENVDRINSAMKEKIVKLKNELSKKLKKEEN